MSFPRTVKLKFVNMSYSADDISMMVPDDPKFAESLAQSFAKIKSMIDEVK